MTPPKRVAIFPGVLNGRCGGATRSATLHAAMLASQDIRTVIFGLYTKSIPAAPEDLPCGQAEIRLYPASEFGENYSSRNLLDDLKKEISQFDLVHLNGHWNLVNYRIAKVCHQQNIPFIISSRGTRRKYSDTKQDRLKERLERFEQLYNRHAAAIHMTSAYELKNSNVNLHHQRIHLIPNAVDLSRFKPVHSKKEARAILGITEGEPCLLYFGRVIPEKNIEFLIKLLFLLPDHVTLKIVGHKNAAYVESLLWLSNTLGVRHRISFIDHTEGAEGALWLTACDTFLLPSFGENFSLALVEAVSTGIKSIVSDQVGAAQYLSPSECTVLPIGEEHLDKWRDTCLSLIDACANDANTSYKHMMDKFSTEAIFREWQELYRTIKKIYLNSNL